MKNNKEWIWKIHVLHWCTPFHYNSYLSSVNFQHENQIRYRVEFVCFRGQEAASTKTSATHFYSWQCSKCSCTISSAIPLVPTGDACSLWSHTCSSLPYLHASSNPSSRLQPLHCGTISSAR
jgi:hypothetical protein